MSEFLTNPGCTRRILDKYGLHAKKKYGQNFLIDADIVTGIIRASKITKDDCVLEIGPGIGTMTQYLALEAGKVVAVEIDESLRDVLSETLDACTNTTVLFQDILKTDLNKIRETYNSGKRLKCVANLPYYITTPILLQLFREEHCFDSITVMVQKEVAERIIAGPGSKDYGALSLAVQYYADPKCEMIVPPHCFMPRPGVDSAVLYLKAYDTPPVDADPDVLFTLIRASFNQRRKTLANALSHGCMINGRTLTRDEVTDALRQLNLPENIRGEKLSLEDFAALSRLLAD